MILLIDIGITKNPSFNKRYINRGLLSIASYLEKKGIDVIFYPMDYYNSNPEDSNKVFEHIKSIIGQFNVDIVAISNMFDSEYSLLESTINFVKKISEDIKVIIGGLSPSFHVDYFEDTLKFDVLVKTEGEFIIYDLITKLRNNQSIDDVQGIVYKKRNNTYSNKVTSFGDVTELPSLNYRLLPEGYIRNETPPVINIELQRGCYNNCSFCSIPSFFGEKVRFHNLNNIIEEFENLNGIGYSGKLVFEDSTIDFKSKRIKLFLNEILKIKKSLSFTFEYITTHYQYLDKESLNLIKKIGFKEIFMGLESASNKVQKITIKEINLDNFIQVAQIVKRYNLNVNVFIIIGLPGETETTFKETYSFVKKNIKKNIISNVFPVHFIPYPNTKAYNDFFKFGGVSISKNLTNWTFQGEAIVNYKHLPKVKLDIMYNKMNNLNKLSKSTYYLNLKLLKQTDDNEDNIMEVPVFYNFYESYKDDLRKVNLYMAEQIMLRNESINYGKLFQLTGFDVVNNYLKSKLKTEKVSYLVDFATVLNTIERGKVIDFISINNKPDLINVAAFESKSISLYESLHSKQIAPFFNEQFMRNNESGNGYITINVNTIPNDIKNIKHDLKEVNENKPLGFQVLMEKNIFFAHTEYKKKHKDFTGEFSKPKISVEDIQRYISVKDIQSYIHYCFNHFFINKKNDTENKLNNYFLSIPVLGTKTNQDTEENQDAEEKQDTKDSYFSAQGALFLYLVSKDEIEINRLKDIATDINYILKDILFNYFVAVGEQLAKEVRMQAIKSAIAAIMSRNISHNLGSHVLAYIRHKLNDVQTIIKENSLKQLLPYSAQEIINNQNLKELIKHLNEICTSNEVTINFNIDKTENIELPFLIGLGYLINYIQERQDFIATISTNHIPYSVPVNFKDAVYDDLNHDYKAIRHKDKMTYKYKGDNLLLDNLARSEGYERKDIKISFRDFNGLNEYERDSEYNLIKDENNIKNNQGGGYDSFVALNNINVVLPGGAIGRQALFSIIENFIRNSAKHASTCNDSENKGLEIKMDLIDLDDENDKEEYNKRKEKIDVSNIIDDSNMKGYYRVELSDNKVNYKNAKEAIQEALSDPYINEDGSLKEDHKGIKEIRISATWLRFLKDETILEGKNYPPVLQLVNKGDCKQLKNETGNVCYVFYLLKPKDLLFVTDNKDLKDNFEGNNGKEAWKPTFNKNGWKLINYDDFDVKTDNRYRLIVFDKNLKNDKTEIDKIRKYCHARVIIIDNLYKENVGKEKEYNFYQLESSNINKAEIFTHFYEKFINNYFIEGLPIIKIIESERNKLKTDEPDFNEKVIIGEMEKSDNGLIVYKDHFDTEVNYNAFEKHLDKTLFVEAISGNNSTDRLIRKTDFDKQWYLNMVESALTKIAVVDERLWSYYSGIKEYELFDNNQDIKIFIDNFKKRNGVKSQEELNNLARNKNVSLSAEEIENILDDNKNINGLESTLIKKINELMALHYNTHNYNVLKQKRIGVYNIIENSGKFFIIEINTQTKHEIKNSMLNEEIFERNSDFDYDFICIHQGLIDKIYTQFYSNTNKNKEKAVLKGQILDYIKDTFKAKNIVVHSGRSRPPSSDLPHRFAFIQYSAINHAIKDCKFCLTELLYSARYE